MRRVQNSDGTQELGSGGAQIMDKKEAAGTERKQGWYAEAKPAGNQVLGQGLPCSEFKMHAVPGGCNYGVPLYTHVQMGLKLH